MHIINEPSIENVSVLMFQTIVDSNKNAHSNVTSIIIYQNISCLQSDLKLLANLGFIGCFVTPLIKLKLSNLTWYNNYCDVFKFFFYSVLTLNNGFDLLIFTLIGNLF